MMKKFVLFLALTVSGSAMAATDLYVNQAVQKSVVAQQQVQALEEAIPAMLRPMLKANIEAIKAQLVAIQADLALSMDPKAPGAQIGSFVCSTQDFFDRIIFTGKAATELEARNAAQMACMKAKGEFLCRGEVTCEKILK